MPRELSTEQVLEIVQRRGLLPADVVTEAKVQLPAQRARLTKRLGGRGGRAEVLSVSVPEVLAALELPRADGGGPLTEDAIMQAVATELGKPWRRLDPVELDVQIVTRHLSRPFSARHACVVVAEGEGSLTVAMAEPTDIELVDNLARITGREIEVVVASRSDVRRIISEFYGFKSTILAAEKEYGRQTDSNLERLFTMKSDAELEATDKHVVAACDYILRHAFEQRASDIHLEPKRGHAVVRYRIDGVLHPMHTIPGPVVPPLTSRLKMMARMDIAERRKPQDGRIKILKRQREIEMRVSSLPTAFGEKVVIRIFDPDTLLQGLDDLGFFDDQRAAWDRFIARPHGIILVTGPTGSGKTTTLYSSLKALATPEVNIVTVEDPIEMVTEAFNQVQVNPRTEVTFARALRTILRQDPDIIMVGEIRDLETAQHAVQAALTGHLVFSTLHTNDAATAFTRLVDIGIEPFLVASTVVGVAAQRLVRTICPSCSTDALLTPEEIAVLGIAPPEGSQTLPVREGAGCVECRGTGFVGRSGIFEVLPVTNAIRTAVQARMDAARLMQVARREGMMTLREAALRKLARGATTFSEVVRVTTTAEEG